MSTKTQAEIKEAKRILAAQKKRASSLSTEHLQCRVGGIRHHWEGRQPDWERSGAILICMQCAVCGTVKRMEVSPLFGEVLMARYEYPDGYMLKRTEGDGTDRLMSPAAVRLELAKRFKDAPYPDVDRSYFPEVS